MTTTQTTMDTSALNKLPTTGNISFATWAKSIPEISKLLSSSSPTDKVTVAALATVFSEGNAKMQAQCQLLNQMAALRVLKNNGTITQDQVNQYNSLQQQVSKFSRDLNADKDAMEAEKAARDEIQKQTLSRLKNATQGKVSYATAQDLYDYIIRTQALNPYLRERQCDRDFIYLLQTVATDLQQHINMTSVIIDLIKNTVISQVTG